MSRLFINGNIRTMDDERSIYESVFVEDGIIKELGSNEELAKYQNESVEVIDLKGRTMLPGFNESHIHLLNYGYGLSKIDCSGAKSIEEIIELGKEYIEKNKPKKGSWILGRGWNQINFDIKREPTRYDLDKISTEYPIVITRICEHVVVANTKAIEISGITEESPQQEGGHFDIEDGKLNGIFREEARYLIYEKIPAKDKDDIKEILKNVTEIAAQNGLTSVQTDDFETFADKNYEIIIEAYKELVEEKSLKVRVYKQCLLPEINRLKKFIDKGYKTGDGDKYFKIGPLKLLTDGSLGARTAFLNEAYSDDPNTRGISVFTQDELDELMETAHINNMQIVTHAIGDGAMHMCFNSFEKAQEKYFIEDARYGILHLQILDDKLVDRFVKNKAIAYAEPICINNDLHMAEERVGDRIKTSYIYKTLLNNKVPMAISSDCPVDSINPMKSIYVGVNRRDYNRYPEGGWYMEESLTVDEMVYGFTKGSAFASFEDNVKGSLEIGKYADMVVLSEDIFEIDTLDIQDVKIEMTIMDGEITFERK